MISDLGSPLDTINNGLQVHLMPSMTNGGLVIRDLSPNNAIASLTSFASNTQWGSVAGRRGLTHDGIDDMVSLPATPANRISGPITISIWVYLRSTTTSVILSTADNTVGFFEIQARSGTDLAWRPGAATEFPGFFSGRLNAAWVHIAVTCDGSASGSRLEGYRDGLFFGRATVAARNIDGGFPLTIGRRSSGGGPASISWDDCRIFNRVLSLPEIALLSERPGIGLDDPRNRLRSYRHARMAVSSGVSLIANPPTISAPVLGTPSLSQNHALTATAPSIAAPTTGTPGVSQNHSITANAPSVASPTTGTPGVSQNHVLTATAPSVAAPTLGTPTLSLAGQLTPNGIAAGAPVLGTPSLTQNHAITVTAPAVAAPTLGTPAIGQNHAIVATAPTIAAPTLGSPVLTLAGGSVSLTPRGITAGAPTLGSPSVAIAGSLTSSDYAFLLLLDVEGKDVTYVNPDGSTSTFKGIVHKANHVKNSEDWGFEEFTTRDVSFMATNDRGRANVMQYAEVRIDGEKFQVERYIRNANRWRCTLKRVEVNEVGRPHRRGRQ